MFWFGKLSAQKKSKLIFWLRGKKHKGNWRTKSGIALSLLELEQKSLWAFPNVLLNDVIMKMQQVINTEDPKTIYARSYSVWIRCTIMKCQTSNIYPQILINQIIIPSELYAMLCLIQTNFAHHLPGFPTSLFMWLIV